jgi:hypothetical protein
VSETPLTPNANSLQFLSLDDLAAQTSSTEWLWQGFLARKNITLLTSQWKTGKTTLLAALMAQLKTGGELAGLPVVAGRALVVSEEAADLWAERNVRFELGQHTWLCRPYGNCPKETDWLEMIKEIMAHHARCPVDLIVIDPLTAFLPGHAESAPHRLKPMLALLRSVCDRGPSLLLLHHPPKGYARAGQAARGSGLLSSFVDILIEMFPFTRADDGDRRRRLQAYSRHQATPLQWVIELNSDGATYAGHGNVSNSEYLHEWPTIFKLLSEAKRKLTIKDFLEAWPPDLNRPAYVTLWRWLDRAVKEGLALKAGQGCRQSPYRYCLPGQEEEWQKNPLYTPHPEDIMEMVEKHLLTMRGEGASETLG